MCGRGSKCCPHNTRFLYGCFDCFHFQSGEVFGDFDVFWACFHTVEDGMAAPDAVSVVDDVDSVVGASVAGIENEPVCF